MTDYTPGLTIVRGVYIMPSWQKNTHAKPVAGLGLSTVNSGALRAPGAMLRSGAKTILESILLKSAVTIRRPAQSAAKNITSADAATSGPQPTQQLGNAVSCGLLVAMLPANN